jgi:ubiquinol-cytochrome c reductase cytochrome b subunit
MSLWGIFMPQTYNLNYFLVLIFVTKLVTGKIHTKIKGIFRIGPHNKEIISIIFGSLLGDAHAEKRILGNGTRISFFQEETHLSYIHYLHKILSEAGYCNSKLPEIKQRLGSKGKIRKITRFHTWTYTSFNWIQEMFYVNGRKCVPQNIAEYLTPLALAVWIMDHGTKVNKGIKLSTNSFTYQECIYLTNALHNNFNLKATIQSSGTKDQYIIYIWKQSMDDLRKIVVPFIIPEMKYKII